MSEIRTSNQVAQIGLGRNRRSVFVEKPADMKSTLHRLVDYFIAEKRTMILFAFVVVISVAANVAAPSLQSSAIDAITQKSFERLPGLLSILFAVYMVYGVAELATGALSARLSQDVVKKLRKDLFEKINTLPISYTDAHSHGDLMSRMTNDAENISNVVSSSLSSLFSGVLTLVGTVAIMLWYSIPLTLLCCSTVILTLFITRWMTKKMRHYFKERQVLLGQLNGIVEEMVTAARTVAAYNRQEAVINQFSHTADSLTKTGIIAEIVSGSMGPVMNLFSNIAFVIVAVFGAWFALRGWITIGVISAFVIYSKQFSRPINEIAQVYGQIQTAIAGAERIFSVLDEPSEDTAGHDLQEKVEGRIEFRHVNFSYVPGKPVIRDFSLSVEPGKKIALVGSTGSGKTTVINLLMRFYEPDSGEILLDGKDIRSISRGSLRDAVGIVLQDTVLFSDTVRSNLCYGNRNATQQEVEAAADFANARRMIAHLPQEYDTMLAESGAELSQGQRQLLAIGRAWLSRPQILILDEATSSVDTRTEKNIQDAMARLMKDHTSLIIAHRLSTIRDADQIIVMDQGSIVEQGSHDELLAKQGRYYSLYMTQFAGSQI